MVGVLGGAVAVPMGVPAGVSVGLWASAGVGVGHVRPPKSLFCIDQFTTLVAAGIAGVARAGSTRPGSV